MVNDSTLRDRMRSLVIDTVVLTETYESEVLNNNREENHNTGKWDINPTSEARSVIEITAISSMFSGDMRIITLRGLSLSALL